MRASIFLALFGAVAEVTSYSPKINEIIKLAKKGRYNPPDEGLWR